jgi:RNA polymerase sigma factor for flagellar operon FliA
MKEQTVGRLLKQYMSARAELHAVKREDQESTGRVLERRAEVLRDRLVVNYSPLVKYAAGRVYARGPGLMRHEDLYSWGIVGLLDAIETYDPGRNTKFESYAISKIRWAILDELRREDWVPRRIRMRAQEVERAKARLSQSLRRPPFDEEVAGDLGMDLNEYRDFLGQYARAQVSSLDARLEVDGGPGVEFQTLVMDSGARDPQSEAEQAEIRAQLTDAIDELKEQERLVATFYFYEGLTLKEIGRALELTEGRISQILRQALNKLRHAMSEQAQSIVKR